MNQDEGGKQPKLAAGAKSDTEIATTFNNTDQGEPSPRLQSSVRGSLSLQITTDGACGASGEEKSALISGLVAQLKRRNITKTELLGRMQDLQRSPEATTTTADVPPESPPLLPADTPDHPHPRQMTAPPGDLSMAQSDQAPQISSTGSATAGGGGTAAAQAVGFFSANDRQVYPAQSELSLSTSGVLGVLFRAYRGLTLTRRRNCCPQNLCYEHSEITGFWCYDFRVDMYVFFRPKSASCLFQHFPPLDPLRSRSKLYTIANIRT